MSAHDMLGLAPLYALDALEGPEKADFEVHLRTCAECRSALDRCLSTVAALVEDEGASEAIWERISTAVSTDPAGTVVTLSKASDQTGSRWKWVAGIAATAAVILAGLLIADLTGDHRLEPADIVAVADQVASQPGSFVGEFVDDDVSLARVVLSSDGSGFVIPFEALPRLDPARTYQLWVLNDSDEAISAGVLGNEPAPATFTWSGEVTGFALTREVAGGVVSSAGDVVSVISNS